MLGAAGTLLFMAGGTALGIALRERRYARLRLMEEALESLGYLRLLLLEERLGLCQLLLETAAYRKERGFFSKRLETTARILEREPLTGLLQAYRRGCQEEARSWEGAEERAVMENLFSQLGTGTAAMREQAVACAMRRLRPLMDEARRQAERGGKLYMQLGLLLGLMVGIALW